MARNCSQCWVIGSGGGAGSGGVPPFAHECCAMAGRVKIAGHSELHNFFSLSLFCWFFFLANLKFVKAGRLLDHCPLIFCALHLPQTSRRAVVHADSSRSGESSIYLTPPAASLLISWGFTASLNPWMAAIISTKRLFCGKRGEGPPHHLRTVCMGGGGLGMLKSSLVFAFKTSLSHWVFTGTEWGQEGRYWIMWHRSTHYQSWSVVTEIFISCVFIKMSLSVTPCCASV